MTPTPSNKPVLWKQWLISSIFSYPVVVAIVLITKPFINTWNTYLQFGVVVPAVTAVMVWFVTPITKHFFDGWMKKP